MAASPKWPSRRVRDEFFSYLDSKSHTRWPSSPIFPVSDPAQPFFHSGMMQFEPVFLGTAAPDSELGLLRRACGSFKCIRYGGHDNVGNDTSHHSLMEVLGYWSFGNYFKEDAIKFSWELLTEVYKLPTDRIYVTYFNGDEKIGLSPDTESFNIWLKYLPKEKILPSFCKSNFWEMGDTGPCGPCTGIHIDHVGNDAAASLEICHLVFVQFNKEADGALRSLSSKHVASGMSVERLTSILQNKMSFYDTDVFIPVFDAIYQCAGDGIQPYSGKVGSSDIVGIDATYRLLADNIRTLSFAIADGSQCGTEGIEYFPKCMLRRALHFGQQNLKTKQGFFTFLVNVFLQVMVDVFPELNDHEMKIKDVIKGEEEIFESALAEVNRGGSSMDNSSRPIDLEPYITSWSCLKTGQEEKEGKLDTTTVKCNVSRKKVTDEARVKYQVGTLQFSDHPYSTLFYGEGYKQSVITRSVPDMSSEEKGSSTSYSRKPLYASVYSPGIRARNSKIGNDFLQFLKGFNDVNSQKLYYKGVALSMICLNSTIMNVKFSHIMQQDFSLSADICYFFESVRQDLNNAAISFILELNSEFEAICSKKFQDFSNLTVCIEGLPEPDRFLSLEAFAKLHGMHFAEPRTICTGKSSMTVADTTIVGRIIGIDLLNYIFEAHAAKKTWNGQFDLKSIFVRNGSKVEIRKPFYHKFTEDAMLNDLIRYVDDLFSLYRLEKYGLPAFFSHLGKSLRNLTPSQFRFPDQLRRFQRFALTHLALKDSMKRVGLFSGLYRIRQTRHVRGLLRAILISNAFGSDWRGQILLQQHPILKRVFNHKKDDESGTQEVTAEKDERGGNKSGNKDKDGDSQKFSQKFSNTPDGVLVYVRHTNEHGPDGPEAKKDNKIEVEGAAEEQEDPIQLLSDLDLLYSHCLEPFLPHVLQKIIFAENVPVELEIMLEEVLEAYNRPEQLKN